MTLMFVRLFNWRMVYHFWGWHDNSLICVVQWGLHQRILTAKLLLNEFESHLQFFLPFIMNVARLDKIGDRFFLFIYVFLQFFILLISFMKSFWQFFNFIIFFRYHFCMIPDLHLMTYDSWLKPKEIIWRNLSFFIEFFFQLLFFYF